MNHLAKDKVWYNIIINLKPKINHRFLENDSERNSVNNLKSNNKNKPGELNNNTHKNYSFCVPTKIFHDNKIKKYYRNQLI